MAAYLDIEEARARVYKVLIPWRIEDRLMKTHCQEPLRKEREVALPQFCQLTARKHCNQQKDI